MYICFNASHDYAPSVFTRFQTHMRAESIASITGQHSFHRLFYSAAPQGIITFSVNFTA